MVQLGNYFPNINLETMKKSTSVYGFAGQCFWSSPSPLQNPFIL